MKKFLKFTLLVLLVPALLFSGCKKENTEEEERKTDPEFQTLTSFLHANQMDMVNILDAPFVLAADIKDILSEKYIIDIRSEGDYNTAHVPGAVNSTLGGILNMAENAGDKQIIVVCVSGQVAGHAVCALRLSGYANAKVLKWGMCGWSSLYDDAWENNTATLDHANWVAAPGSILTSKEFDDPDLSTMTNDGAAMLIERVAAMLSKGFQGIPSTTVLDNPGSYFINNYFEATDVEDYGNIVNAYRIKPLSITGELFKHIDPSKTDVTYCWTGQNSSIITAYMTVIGFNAISLKYGVNSIIFDDLTAHKWSTPAEDLPTEP